MVDWNYHKYSDPYFNILYKDGSVETLQLSKLLVYDDDQKTLNVMHTQTTL